MIANRFKHKKKQDKHGRFPSMLLKALAFFADVKHKGLKRRGTKSHGVFRSSSAYLLCSKSYELVSILHQEYSFLDKHYNYVIYIH